LKFTKSCKNASKNEIYLQEIYQSSNQEMFAISLSSCSRYNANFKLDHQCPLFMTVRHIFEISEDDHPPNTPTKIRYYKDVPLCENYVRDFFYSRHFASKCQIQRYQSLNTENPTPSVSPPFWQ
jgi:hypothetical protein